MLFRLVEKLLVEEEHQDDGVVYLYRDLNDPEHPKYYYYDGTSLNEISEEEVVNIQKGSEDEVRLPDESGYEPSDDSQSDESEEEGTDDSDSGDSNTDPSNKKSKKGGRGLETIKKPELSDEDIENIDSYWDETFAGMLSDAEDDVRRATEREFKKNKEREYEEHPNIKKQDDLLQSMKDFIGSQLRTQEVETQRKKTNKRTLNMRRGSGIIDREMRDVEVEEESPDLPIVAVFLDNSGSCSSAKISALIENIFLTVNELSGPRGDKLIIDEWWFGERVRRREDKDKGGKEGTGGGTLWKPVQEKLIEISENGGHIVNAVIVTDRDTQGEGGIRPVTIRGSVWYVAVNGGVTGMDKRFNFVRAKGQTAYPTYRQFDVDKYEGW